jgi:putative hydrolase
MLSSDYNDIMFEADFHSHSLFSGCGLHSIIEMLTAARKTGLKALAITDHGPYLGNTITSVFFERLRQPVEGIHLLKGMECNFTDEDGEIDIIPKYMHNYDVVLAGFHRFVVKDADPNYYSKIIKKAIKKNPCIDIIVHPNAPHYVSDFLQTAEDAAEAGVAIELNNAKTALGKSSEEQTMSLIEACMKAGCEVAVNTDAHALNEIGDTAVMEGLLDEAGFPFEKIVNRSIITALEWVESRKEHRRVNFPE